jgi:hypothetical protein
MLKITKSTQPIQINTLVGVIYSPPGLGKTTMAFTAEKPLLLDADRGSYRAKNRKDIVEIEKWSDVAGMTADDFAGYSTVVVDTAGRALDVLAQDIIRENPKMARGGALSLQGFGELKTRFTAWIKLIRSFGLDVILIAHSDENRKGDEVIERLDVQGASKNEIYKSADFMGRISIVNGQRVFNLSPTDTAFGKNPGQLPPLEVPHYDKDPEFLAGVIAKTKGAINALTQEQTRVAGLLAEWAATFEKLKTAEEFTAQIEPVKGADEAVRDNAKRLLVKVAKDRGFAFDTKAGVFIAPPTATVPTEGGSAASAANETTVAASETSKPTEREVGADDGDEEANRKAAEPTAEEQARIDAERAATLPGVDVAGTAVGSKGKKAKAA